MRDGKGLLTKDQSPIDLALMVKADSLTADVRASRSIHRIPVPTVVAERTIRILGLRSRTADVKEATNIHLIITPRVGMRVPMSVAKSLTGPVRNAKASSNITCAVKDCGIDLAFQTMGAPKTPTHAAATLVTDGKALMMVNFALLIPGLDLRLIHVK